MTTHATASSSHPIPEFTASPSEVFVEAETQAAPAQLGRWLAFFVIVSATMAGASASLKSTDPIGCALIMTGAFFLGGSVFYFTFGPAATRR